jgi:hypothetical protein
MKATEAKFLDFIKKSPQFVIPTYQRTYSWTERECRQLWRRWGNSDMEVAFTSLENLQHIMGLVRKSFGRQMGNEGEP